MKYSILIVSLICFTLLAHAQHMTYPAIRNLETLSAKDTLYGYIFTDPYRGLENLDDPKIKTWFEAQRNYAKEQLSQYGQQPILYDELQYLHSLKKNQVDFIFPQKSGLFYKKVNSQSLNEEIILRDSQGLERVLFSTNRYPDSLSATINFFRPAPDSKHIVLGISFQNKELAKLRILDVKSEDLLDEIIPRNLLSIPEWSYDGKGFYYHQLQATPDPQQQWFYSKTKYHRLNTSHHDDIEVLSSEILDTLAPQDFPFVYSFEDSEFILGIVQHGIEPYPSILLRNTESGVNNFADWKFLFRPEDKIRAYSMHRNHLFVLKYTEHENGELVKLTVDKSGSITNTLTVDFSTNDTIFEDIIRNDDGLFLLSSKFGTDYLSRYDLVTLEKTNIELPFSGNIQISNWMYGIASKKGDKLYFSMESWDKDESIYCYDYSGKITFKTELLKDIEYKNFSKLSSSLVEVKGNDGTMIPLTLIHRSDLNLDKAHPTILDAYGAYGLSIDPRFDINLFPWFERGGIVAIAHIRGGGEKGPSWHEEGRLLKKSNGWKDYVSCAEYLISHNMTKSSQLVARSASAGTVSVGKAVIEKPELFGVAILRVGLMNPLRHEFTPNNTNAAEFGTIEDSVQMIAMSEYDPYMSIKSDTEYPAMLFTAGTNDPRVTLWQPGKMVARLQASDTERDILFRISQGAGHFSEGEEQWKETADIYAFIFHQLGINFDESRLK